MAFGGDICVLWTLFLVWNLKKQNKNFLLQNMHKMTLSFLHDVLIRDSVLNFLTHQFGNAGVFTHFLCIKNTLYLELCSQWTKFIQPTDSKNWLSSVPIDEKCYGNMLLNLPKQQLKPVCELMLSCPFFSLPDEVLKSLCTTPGVGVSVSIHIYIKVF